MDINLDLLTPSARNKRLAEEYKKDYKFYLKCRRVLYKRGAKKKLIERVNREIEHAGSMYWFYMNDPKIISTRNN